MELLYPLHPVTVHFPVALLLANALLTLLYLRGWGAAYETSAYHCLVLGWLGAVVATLSGAWDAWQQVYGPDAPRDVALLNWVNAHAAVGLAIVGVYGRALLLRRRQPDVLADAQARRGYLRLLLLGALLVLVGGWLGGYLVYTLGLGR
jgi:uncharacterized membrane protein